MAENNISINLQPFFRQMQPEILNQLKKSLEQQQVQLTKQLSTYRIRLTSLVAQITKLAGDGSTVLATDAHRNAYTRLLNTFNSLSANGMIQQQNTVKEVRLNKLVKELFVLEHKIMGLLAPDSATNKYEIFYSDPKHGDEKILDKTISATILYRQELVSMTKTGKLTDVNLTLHQVLKAQGKKKSVSNQDKKNITELALEAIANMQIWLQELEKMAKEEHLGRHNWRRLMELRLLLGTTKEDTGKDFYKEFLKDPQTGDIDNGRLEQLINYYINNQPLKIKTHKRTLGKNKRVYTRKRTYYVSPSQNRGHIFEGLIRMRNDSTMGAREALKASINNGIWWAQGDFNDIQIKTLLGGNTSVDIASLNSVFDLANYLLQLLNVMQTALKQLNNYLNNQVSSDIESMDISKANKNASDYANSKRDEIIKELRKSIRQS